MITENKIKGLILNNKYKYKTKTLWFNYVEQMVLYVMDMENNDWELLSNTQWNIFGHYIPITTLRFRRKIK